DACGRLPEGAAGSCGGKAAVGGTLSASVRPELVEGPDCPELVEGPATRWASAGSARAAPWPCTIAIRSPWLILSPTLTFNSLSTPAALDGISIEALSLSTVMSDCS